MTQQEWDSKIRHTSSISSLLNDKQHLPSPVSPATPNHDISSLTTTTAPRPYICKQCDQSFCRAHNLKSHLATHSAERPFKCDTCNHYFRRQHDLKRHQKLHTGERPHICKNCGRSFARLDALSRHQRAEVGHVPTGKKKPVATAGPVATTVTGVDNTPRPMIPQLNIPNPASKPYISSPTTNEEISVSLPPLRSHNNTNFERSPVPSPTSYRTWPYPHSLSSPPSPLLNRITLPSPDHLLLPLQQQVRSLSQENSSLKQEIKQMSIDSARVQDLEIE
ncbi:hypothetical protein INT47_008638, partial [Mucor saturninus]